MTIELRTRDADEAERLLAEAWAAGLSGCEERDSGGSGTCWLLYVEAARAESVGRALRAVAVDSEIGAPRPVLERDWSRAWREGLGPVVVSARLVVRPPFAAAAAAPGRAEVVIDPGQAFGTGEHESTRLALELLDRRLAAGAAGLRVLDVGTGSGVLAIAAVKLGAAGAVGFDLDPVATGAAAEAVGANGVAGAVEIRTGGIATLDPGRFDLVVANLLRREVEPILGDVLERVAEQGVAIFTGLLASDRAPFAAALDERGFEVVEEARRDDARGDRWIGLVAGARRG